MPKEIDSQSRSILNFRPVIDFVEPAVEAATPNPVAAPPPIIDDIVEAEKVRVELFNLAESVDVLATALQARIDLKAKDMAIKLDPLVDSLVIDAINRAYPDLESGAITYDMYKQCRENMRLYADAQAAKNNVSQEDIAAAAQDPNGIASIFNSAAAKDGSLRPERMPKAQLIDPIDLSKFQISLIKILANFIWQMFVIKAFDISVAGVGVKGLLPHDLPGAKLNKTEKKILSQLKKAGIPIPN